MGRILRVRAASTGWVGAPGLNTFYFRDGDGVVVPDVAAANICIARVRAAFDLAKAMYPTQWSVVVSGQVDVLDDTTGALLQELNGTAGAPVVGTLTDGFSPLVSMVLLRIRTDTITDGKRIQGRAFLGPVGRVTDADGSPQSGAMDVALAMGNHLLTEGTTTSNLVVWRRPREAAAGPPVVTARPGSSALATAVSVPDKYAALRSRRD